ncbi:glutathione ABC transporter substrate-binding protein [Brevibacillus fluminis]|uniref:Glutathione ABC transporter substrate-binding protein n=1 Tax=Brevibacillus fluminis TaxID=511487 RepID=A0A3M8D0T3_9BACL|nr:ABC transporter substrate-binding protein [Brevibacillus fluminis]RNB81684.1 glutathione ABC transporter substrate-binding protein [Brevibacillus fluminis]
MGRKISVFVIVFLLIGSVIAGCSSQSANGTSGGTEDTLIVGIPDAPVYMDPQIQASVASYRVTTQIFDRLVALDSKMKLVPALAESWEVENDTTTVFHLRKGVKFHNGEEMKAEDVKFSLERAIKNDGVNYNYLIIKDIVIVDDYTVKIVTSQPFNALLYRLTLDAASILSKKAASSDKDFNAHPVGAGPYKFVSWDLGGDVVLEAFPDYYRGEPKVKKLIFRQIPEALNRTVGLETGEIGLAYDLARTDLDKVKSNQKLKLEEVTSTTVWYLGFNTKKQYFDDVRVRQAIAYALNTKDIIDIVFNGVATPAHNTMLPPDVVGFVPDSVTYDFNLDKAKSLLAEAGHPNGFKTTLWVPDSQIPRDAAVVIQGQLRAIGIDVEVKTMEQGKYYSATGKGEHDLFFMSKTSIDPDSMLRAMYHTQAFGLSGNRSFWSTKEVDEKLDKASETTDPNEAKKLYADVQKIVAEQLPLVPIGIEHLNAGMQATVKGFNLYPGKTHFIYGTYFEK